jgi:hypothetical protein
MIGHPDIDKTLKAGKEKFVVSFGLDERGNLKFHRMTIADNKTWRGIGLLVEHIKMALSERVIDLRDDVSDPSLRTITIIETDRVKDSAQITRGRDAFDFPDSLVMTFRNQKCQQILFDFSSIAKHIILIMQRKDIEPIVPKERKLSRELCDFIKVQNKHHKTIAEGVTQRGKAGMFQFAEKDF